MSESSLRQAELGALLARCGGACVVVAPSDWRVQFVTDRYLQLTGRTRADSEGCSIFELWAQALGPGAQAELLARLSAVHEGAQASLHAFQLEHSEQIWLEHIARYAADGVGPHLVHLLEGPFPGDTAAMARRSLVLEERVRARDSDLEQTSSRLLRETAEHMKTERALKRSEEQLKQAQKLDALGRLAGGIAHDFNNLLSVILGYSSVLAVDHGVTPGARAQINEIREAAERAADLTLQLLAFSRCQVLEPRVVDLNLSLLNLERMLRRLLGEDIELRMMLEPQLGRVKVDPGQIEQVIMNLVINARDAMPTGGALSIETANVDIDEDYAHEHVDTSAGPHVMLSVSDSGCGMDKATLARIFEPFFTTKGPGKGTGLGLSTAFGIIKQSGGTIWVYSEVGSGTSFKVYIPRVDAAAEQPRHSSLRAQATGSETVLVVEDDAHVRKLACNVLEAAGYHVHEAQDADEALSLFEGSIAELDLLLTDVVMPKTSGRALAERVLLLRPGVKVLFMSGYTDDAVLRHGVAELGAAFLQKPLTPTNLTRKVREVLDQPASTSGG
ncbi:MAG TPA: ATP-binding protein [Polyangiales bacterium]